MKINIQKWTRAIPCFLAVVFFLLVSVAPASAATMPGRYYTFNEHIEQPEDSDTMQKLLDGYSINGTTYETGVSFDYIGLKVSGATLFLQFPIDGNRSSVASFNIGAAIEDSTWLLREYQVIFFPADTSVDDDILAWLEANGKFTTQAPIIGLPEFDFDSIFDEDLITGEYMTYANKLGILLRSNVTLPIVLSLFGLVLISFILYGKK